MVEENKKRIEEEKRIFKEQKEREKAGGAGAKPSAPIVSAQLSRATVGGAATHTYASSLVYLSITSPSNNGAFAFFFLLCVGFYYYSGTGQ
jgi:hypothetical protein